MKWLSPRVVVALLSAAASCLPSSSGAENGYWEPPGIRPTTTARGVVLEKIAAYRGPVGSGRNERYSVTANGLEFAAEATSLGEDFVVRSTLDDATYASGRSAGYHWRATSAGVVHLVESDVQGDDLDRWPTARLALAPTCVLAGEAGTAGNASWVLLDRREHDIPHWFYVAETTGAIVREVTREGTRVETTTFDDWRTADGATLPYHWRVDGPGGALDVSVRASRPAAPTSADLAVPKAGPPILAAPMHAETLSSEFGHRRINVMVRLDGKPHSLVLDTGTPQIVIGNGLARAVRAHVALEHAVLPRFTVGEETATNVPVFSVGGWDGGILGYDFFLGRIVHIDYAKQRVEELPRETFVAPPDARELLVDFAEGMPVVAATVGDVLGERFVLDTGSPHVIILAGLLRRKHRLQRDLDISVVGVPRVERYLEGPIETETVNVNSLMLGPAKFVITSAEFQNRTTSEDSEFPIDGIIGTDVLGHFEWWFDATGDRAWYRWQG